MLLIENTKTTSAEGSDASSYFLEPSHREDHGERREKKKKRALDREAAQKKRVNQNEKLLWGKILFHLSRPNHPKKIPCRRGGVDLLALFG